ncbi:hypothetical protein FA13DRAFT_1139511 [Coprinellus micaceus]|uniref:Uncharacterized protein n=1 Tax=Coprinellus micaceus TaxID=71717 RepID=A0A4Y7RKH3_COPMI|nr:hypothetical protein FA13DRAFT_1139511 [Coprinellus micaceus]
MVDGRRGRRTEADRHPHPNRPIPPPKPTRSPTCTSARLRHDSHRRRCRGHGPSKLTHAFDFDNVLPPPLSFSPPFASPHPTGTTPQPRPRHGAALERTVMRGTPSEGGGRTREEGGGRRAEDGGRRTDSEGVDGRERGTNVGGGW